MTKLMQWLCGVTAFFSIWTSLITNRIENNLMRQYPTLMLYLPLILLILFGTYAATVVLFRTLTFNNCEKEALELQEEIEEARKDLKARGFIFRDEKR